MAGTQPLQEASALFPDQPAPLPDAATLFPDEDKTLAAVAQSQALGGRSAAAIAARLNKGNILNSAIKGFSKSFGSEPVGAEAISGLDSAMQGAPGPLRFWGHALLNPVLGVGDLINRTAAGTVGGLAGAFGQVVSPETDESKGEVNTAERDMEGMLSYALWSGDYLNAASPYAQVSRVQKGADGKSFDQPIGPIPSPVEAKQQIETIRDHFGLPESSVDIMTAWYEGRGELPAEIFHDLKSNPARLSELATGKPLTQEQKLFESAAAKIQDAARLLKPAQLEEMTARPGKVPSWATNVTPEERAAYEGPADVSRSNVSQAAEPATVAPNAPLQPLRSEEPGVAVPAVPEAVQPAEAARPTGPGEVPGGETPAAGVPAAEAAKPPVVPTRLRPIEGTGEKTPLQLSQSVEEAVDKVFEGVPVSRRAENAVQEEAARKFVTLDPERADAVAMYAATPPKNLLSQSVYNEVLRRANEAGDSEKVRQMVTQSAQPGVLRRMGQEIQIASRVAADENDVSALIQQAQEARTAALRAQGIDVTAEADKLVQAARKTVRAARQPVSAWSSFIQEITCK